MQAVCGIDPGLVETGYCVLRWPERRNRSARFFEEAEFIKSKVIEADKEASIHARVGEFFYGFELLAARIPAPSDRTFIAVESIFVGSNRKLAIGLARVMGALETVAIWRNLGFTIITTQQAKQAVTGSGKGTKTQGAAAFRVWLRKKGIDTQDTPRTQHEIDAWAVAIAAGELWLCGKITMPPDWLVAGMVEELKK